MKRILSTIVVLALFIAIGFALNFIIRSPESSMTQNNPHATLITNEGVIVLELFADKAPQTVKNFITLADQDFYDGVRFHRVISGFMIQSGDPLSKDLANQNFWGTGGPGYTFDDEIYNENRNNKGTISMANAGPNTNGSQFFINVADNNFLDTKHTVFGKVIEGYEIVEKISQTPTADRDLPIDDIIIQNIMIDQKLQAQE